MLAAKDALLGLVQRLRVDVGGIDDGALQQASLRAAGSPWNTSSPVLQPAIQILIEG
jgi:hypothetical protein